MIFYWQVYNTVNGNTGKQSLLFCPTGARSIEVANIYADPQNTANDPRKVAVPGDIPFITYAREIVVEKI